MPLGYFDNDPLVIADQLLAELWLVQRYPTDTANAVIVQSGTLP